MSVIKLGSLMAAIAMMLSPQARASSGLDLTTPEGNVDALVKLRCSLDQTEDVILWWSGTIFGQLPGKAPAAILGFEGYNICRSEKLGDGIWRLRTPELTFYRDLETGQIIDQWHNSLSGQRNDVLHVAIPGDSGRIDRLIVWLNGAAAEHADRMAEPQRMAWAITELEKLRPASVGSLAPLATRNWGADPLADGAFSEIAPGQVAAVMQWSAARLGQVHFAGEQTVLDAPGMEAAVLSGERAAKAILG